ncbi:unnamed protein product [Rhizoctonia solani]|uniref:Uncharacterized protein n=1 Tax=Rhizoctonia solani TaxID=456999 RepID=A0A8H2XQZ7_9AGAM|nr:unnamed protein product [Rhizoctonia solani]
MAKRASDLLCHLNTTTSSQSVLFSTALDSARNDKFTTPAAGCDAQDNYPQTSAIQASSHMCGREVYQSIMDVCGYTVPSISNSDSYYPVTIAQLCMCNTVAYNLGSACQDCQRGSTDQGILFSTYIVGGDGCVAPITSLPDSVVPAQQVPEWALLDTSTLFWSYSAAQTIANSTATTTTSESVTATSTGTTMDQSPTITLSDPTGSSGPSTTAGPLPSTSKSTNAGAIGGGVAGGVVFLLLVIGIFLFLRRRRARNPSSNTDAGVGAIGGRQGSTSSESSLTESGKAGGSNSHYTPHSQMAQLNHSGGSGSINPSHSTSALTTPVDAPPVPSIAHEYPASSTAYSRTHDYASSHTPSRSHATSPTPSAPAIQKVKRVPVRYSEDELARAEDEDRVAVLSSSPPR